jgi:hypothetical protein
MSTDPHPQEILHNTVIRGELGLDQFRTLVNDKIKIMMMISIKANAYRLYTLKLSYPSLNFRFIYFLQKQSLLCQQ